MKIRTDILRTYTDVHTWVGIVAGLALFIAFYAGAITMFEEPLRRWASPPAQLPPAVSLEHTPELLERLVAAHPETAARYTLHLRTDADTPARISWQDRDGHRFGAALDVRGELATTPMDEAPVAQLVDVLHQQVGLPFEHEVSMPIMGVIALLYGVALVSGVIVLLPTLMQDLFAWRAGRNLKRMWLDVHNSLGVFSLPFHVVMALTSVVFAFHDQIYDVQDAVVYGHTLDEMWAADRLPPPQPQSGAAVLAPLQLVARLREQAPGFTPVAVEYRSMPSGVMSARVLGYDDAQMHRAPTYGLAQLDPYSGQITQGNYLPGHQSGWDKTLTSFFTLHFGSFGGTPVRWVYFLLGLAGAFLFYSGNLIWIEARRRRQRRGDPALPAQKRSHRVMAALTVGVCVGCIAGISLTVAAAKWLPGRVTDLQRAHTWIYYAVFLGCTAWALWRGAARASAELLAFAAAATLMVPLASLLAQLRTPAWQPSGLLIDAVALVAAVLLALFAVLSRRRALHGDPDSVWSLPRPAAATPVDAATARSTEPA
ncbi:MAG: PepSY-associated TM helix domain-containing protein [Steroidobacteraceae bacterium]